MMLRRGCSSINDNSATTVCYTWQCNLDETGCPVEESVPVLQGTLIVVTFCRLAVTRLQHRQRQAESPRHPNRRQQRRLAQAEKIEDRENIIVSAIEAVTGGYRKICYINPNDVWGRLQAVVVSV